MTNLKNMQRWLGAWIEGGDGKSFEEVVGEGLKESEEGVVEAGGKDPLLMK